MKKAILYLILAAELLSATLFCPFAGAQKSKRNKETTESTITFSLPSQETREQKLARMKWWTDARFGMFIHFGLYSAGARHEWMRKYERMTAEDYDAKYFQHFKNQKLCSFIQQNLI